MRATVRCKGASLTTRLWAVGGLAMLGLLTPKIGVAVETHFLLVSADTEIFEPAPAAINDLPPWTDQVRGQNSNLNVRSQNSASTPRHETILTRFDLPGLAPGESVLHASYHLTTARSHSTNYNLNLVGLFEADAGNWDESTLTYTNNPFYYQDVVAGVGGATINTEWSDYIYDRWDLVPDGATDLSAAKFVELVGNAAGGVSVGTTSSNQTISLSSDNLASFLQTALENGDDSVSLLLATRTNASAQFKFHSREAVAGPEGEEVPVPDEWKPHLMITIGVPGDINSNGVPDLDDFDVIRGNLFLSTNEEIGFGYAAGDLDFDGDIDFDDFGIWKTSYLASGGSLEAIPMLSSVAVPEPAFLGVLLMLVSVFGFRRLGRRLALSCVTTIAVVLIAAGFALEANAAIIVASADTTIAEPNPSDYIDAPVGDGVATTLNARTYRNSGTPRHEAILTRFDLSGFSPGTLIQGASFHLTTAREHDSHVLNLVGLFEADAGDWEEATVKYSNNSFMYPDANNAHAYQERNQYIYDLWDLVPDGDVDLSEAKFVELVGDASGGVMVAATGDDETIGLSSNNLISFLQTAIDNGDSSVSLLLLTRTSLGAQFKFHSREADVDDEWKPHLNLTLAPTAAVPEPAFVGVLLMLVSVFGFRKWGRRLAISRVATIVAVLGVTCFASQVGAVTLVASADLNFFEPEPDNSTVPAGDATTLNVRWSQSQSQPRFEATLTRFDISGFNPGTPVRGVSFHMTTARSHSGSYELNLVGLFEADAGGWDEATASYANAAFLYQDSDQAYAERTDYLYDRWDLVPNGATDLSEAEFVELVGDVADGVTIPATSSDETIELSSDNLVSFLQTAIDNGDDSVSLLLLTRTNRSAQFKFHSREANVDDLLKPHLNLTMGFLGDLTGDNLVDLDDLEIIRNNFYRPVGSYEEGDLDENGFVDFLDYRIWRDNADVPAGAVVWTPSPQQVPEPATLVGLVTMSLLAVLIRRRRALVALAKSRQSVVRYLLAGLFCGATSQVGLAAVVEVPFLPTTTANWNTIDVNVWQNQFEPGVPPNALYDEIAIISSGGTAQVTNLPTDVGGINLTNGAVEILSGGNLTVRPGDPGDTTGTITVGANGRLGVATGGVLNTRRLVLQNGGTFSADIASSLHSPISVGQDAILNGNLAVTFSSAPALGTYYPLIDASTLGGSFSSITVDAPGSLGLGQAVGIRTVSGGSNGRVLQVGVEQRLVLNVDRGTGAVSILNPATSTENFQLDGYVINSAIGSLSPAGWNSLAAQGVDGGTWHIGGSEGTPQQLAELSTGAANLAPGGSRNLGALYAPNFVEFGQNPDEDFTFTYRTVTGGTAEGLVNYIGDKQYNNIVITVDETGHAVMQNESPFSVSFEGYTIGSESGALRIDWASLMDQGAVNGGWLEAGPTANRLSEVMFQTGVVTTLHQGQGFDLGQLMNVGGSFEQDLVFEFLMPGETTLFQGVVVYGELPTLPEGLLGDYNGDGKVDLADYTVWRNALGQSIALPNESPLATPGVVTIEDYAVWKQYFGSSSGGGALATTTSPVPEPQTLAFALAAVATLVGWRARGTSVR